MQIQPYLSFGGRCEEAIEFYKKALGAEVLTLLRVKDSPDPACMPDMADDKVMHVCLRVGESQLMADDMRRAGESGFQGFSLTLSAADATEADRLFTALGEGGQVCMPLAPTFFASSFGMVVDRFGVSWMIVVPLETRAA